MLVFSEDRLIREISDRRVRQSIAAARKVGAKAVVFHTNFEPALTAKAYSDNQTAKKAYDYTVTYKPQDKSKRSTISTAAKPLKAT